MPILGANGQILSTGDSEKKVEIKGMLQIQVSMQVKIDGIGEGPCISTIAPLKDPNDPNKTFIGQINAFLLGQGPQGQPTPVPIQDPKVLEAIAKGAVEAVKSTADIFIASEATQPKEGEAPTAKVETKEVEHPKIIT